MQPASTVSFSAPPLFFFFASGPKPGPWAPGAALRAPFQGRTGVAGRLSPQTDNPACSYNTEYRELRTSCLSDTQHWRSGCLIASRRVTLAGTADAPSVSWTEACLQLEFCKQEQQSMCSMRPFLSKPVYRLREFSAEDLKALWL